MFNCEYTWNVEAFNKNGIKISEMDQYHHFTVTGAQYNCIIKILKLLSNSNVPSSGIELEWESHPLADHYKLSLWSEKDYSTQILDYVEVLDTTYTITDILQPGKYILSINAYDQESKYIAGSKIVYLNVS